MKRKGELFRRIKPTTLAKLINDQCFSKESVFALAEGSGSPGKEEEAPQNDSESIYSYQSMASGVSAVTYATDQLGITVFLLYNPILGGNQIYPTGFERS